MNEALFSSKNMNWCTPQEFFDELNAEFHFALDAAATDKSAKCPKYYTPETDGLKQPWIAGGVLFSAILRTESKLANGCGRHTKKHREGQRSSFLFRPARTRHIFTITSTAKRNCASCAAA